MLLYHINVGFPVAGRGRGGARAGAVASEPRGDHPSRATDRSTRRPPGSSSRSFEHENAAEPDGSVPVAVVNRGLGLGAYEVYRQDQLPFHFMWRMLGEGTYVVGIEPCTNRTAGRLDARTRGELIELGPGEKRSYDLELGALVGAAEIDAFAARVGRVDLVSSRRVSGRLSPWSSTVPCYRSRMGGAG